MKFSQSLSAGVALTTLTACPPPYAHVEPDPPYSYERHFPDNGGDLGDPLALAEYASPQARPGQDPDLLLILTLSGGGHRAANMGVGAMLGLEELGLLDEVDYVSTVSGGGFAAAQMIRYLDQRQDSNSDSDSAASFAEFIDPASEHAVARDNLRALERGYTGPAAYGIFVCGVLGTVTAGLGFVALCPRHIGSRDYGDALEALLDRELFRVDDGGIGPTPACEALPEVCMDPERRAAVAEDNCMPAQSTSPNLGLMFERAEGGEAPRLPYWIANSTNWANGARVPMTPGVFARMGALHFPHHMRMVSSREQGDDVPLSLVVRASANFLVYPSVTLTDTGCGPRLHDAKLGVPVGCIPTRDDPAHVQLVDGGISDNLGLLTAEDIIRHERASDHPPKTVVVITVDAFNGTQNAWTDKGSSGVFKANPWTIANAYMANWRHVAYLEFGTITRRDPSRSWIPMGFETACESDTLCRWRTEGDPDAEPEAEAARLEARQVPTNFNVTPAQQRSLIAFGKALVLANTEALKLATAGTPVAPAEATTGSRLIAG